MEHFYDISNAEQHRQDSEEFGMAEHASKENIFARISRFARESWAELLKCSWPSKEELIKSTGMVLLFVLIVAVWIAGFDFIFGLMSRHLLNW